MAAPFSLVCLHPASGEVRWERESAEELTTPRPLVWKRSVVVGREGRLLALDLRDGSRLWELPLGETPRGLGASAEALYVGTREGTLMALPWP